MPEAVIEEADVLDEQEQAENAARDAQEAERKVISLLTARIEDAQRRNQDHVEEYKEIARLYRVRPEKRDIPAKGNPGVVKANIATPEMLRIVESVVSGIMALIKGEKRGFDLQDPSLDDQMTSGLYHTREIIRKGHERCGYWQKVEQAVRSWSKFGRLTCEVFWDAKSRVRVSAQRRTIDWQDPNTGEVYPVEANVAVESEEPDYAYPMLRPVEPWNVVMDPSAERVADARWIMVRRKLSKETLEEWMASARERGQGTVRELGDIGKEVPKESNDGTLSTPEQVSRDIQQQIGVRPEERDAYTVWDYWGLHPTAMDPREDRKDAKDPRYWRIVIVENSKAVIEEPNPYWHGRLPFVDAVMIPEEETAEGMGIGQITKVGQIVLNGMASQSQEMVNIGVAGIWQREGAMTSQMGKAIRFYAGRVLDADVDGKFTRIPNDPVAYRLVQSQMATIIDGIRYAAAAPPSQQAAPSGANFAAEVRSIGAVSSQRIANLAASFADQIIRPFIEMEAELYEQFLPDDTEIRTMVPWQGRMVSVAVPKAALRLRGIQATVILSTDQDYMKTLSRNLNQSMKTIADVTQLLLQQAGPMGAPAVMEAMMPPIVELAKKQLVMFDVSPDSIPPDLVAQLSEQFKMQQALAAMMPPAAGNGGPSADVVA